MTKPFRLKVLLEQKQREEEQQMLVLAERNAEWRRACDVLDTLRDAERDQLRHLESLAGAARIDAAQQRDAVAYLGRIEASIAVQRGEIADAEARVHEAREALVAVLREKRTLERLRERHLEEAAREEARREANAVDEITSARYARALQQRQERERIRSC